MNGIDIGRILDDHVVEPVLMTFNEERTMEQEHKEGDARVIKIEQEQAVERELGSQEEKPELQQLLEKLEDLNEELSDYYQLNKLNEKRKDVKESIWKILGEGEHQVAGKRVIITTQRASWVAVDEMPEDLQEEYQRSKNYPVMDVKDVE